ncbi:hypothetical protein PFLUV_G00041410 [Perca fluviatilis]|uniref:Golgin subfamily A member 7 n=1 Tax=Perca fluviatilis TaxID=8168 RepID=A0A6A5FHB0_PERFL|nr:hypothetical protein PFLUV_G00041410 [Perca fluviatilis]
MRAAAIGKTSNMAETHSLQDLQQPAVSSKVFVQRDYSSGTISKFQTKFPSELESRLDKQQFEETIQTLNNLYAEAEKLGAESYLEGCLACLTAYTIFLCMETHYEKVLKKIAREASELLKLPSLKTEVLALEDKEPWGLVTLTRCSLCLAAAVLI